MTNSRDKTIDIIRALCAIYIISIFHLNSYYSDEFLFSEIGTIISKMLTIIALAGFTFISGFCLSKYKFDSFADVKVFYKKRFFRFYFLYFVSACTLFIAKYIFASGWFESNTQFLLTLLGFSSFYNPIPHTLWYFGMLIFFYLITPLLKMYQGIKSLIPFLLIFLVLIIYDAYFFVDRTLFLYFPVYYIGLLKPMRLFKLRLKECLAFSSLSIVCLCGAYFAIYHWGLLFAFEFLIILPGIIVLVCFARLLSRIRYITTLFTYISLSSMVAYLFHRHFFAATCLLYSGHISGPINPIVGIGASVVLFIISYVIQISYDKFINCVVVKK